MAAIVGTKSTEKYVRENEAVAVDPFGVLGVESHELVEQDVGNRGHAHRGARVTRVGLRGGIDLQSSRRQQLSLFTSRQIWISMYLVGKRIGWRSGVATWWGRGRGEQRTAKVLMVLTASSSVFE